MQKYKLGTDITTYTKIKRNHIYKYKMQNYKISIKNRKCVRNFIQNIQNFIYICIQNIQRSFKLYNKTK